MDPAPPTRCHLLELPPELRDAIFTFAVVKDKPIHILSYHLKPVEPLLLAVCRQIRAECLPLFFGANVFRMYESQAEPFIRHLGEDRVKLVRKLRPFTSFRPNHMGLGWHAEHVLWWLRHWIDECSKGKLRKDAVYIPLWTGTDWEWEPGTRMQEWRVEGSGLDAYFVRKDKQDADEKLV